MMKRLFLAGAAVFTAAALAACGSSGDGKDPEAGGDRRSPASGPSVAGPASTPTAAPTAAPGAEDGGDDGGDDGSGTGAARTPEPPKVPSDQLTPATGTFTEPQKEYLADRVPRGMDPAAVLQTGQETCDKLRYLVKVDRRTAVASIVTDEVPGAAPAVAHLCPAYQDLVDEAARGYADGTHAGTALRPGRYRSAAPTTACTWEIRGAGGKALGNGTSHTGEPVRITVAPAARTFTSTGCYAWLPEGDDS